jgi:hypoxanthine phosphoribosyltransferase
VILTETINPQTLLTNSALIYSVEEVEAAIDAVAQQINHQFGHTPIILMCVMTGGLYFTGKLLSKLNMPIELDYVQANRYHAHLTGGTLVWTKLPTLALQNKIVLLVDDILDEGLTLQAVFAKCVELGAKTVSTVVMANKLNQQSKPIQADFKAFDVPNLFVFGCGMDAHGWWRNLPEIRALK